MLAEEWVLDTMMMFERLSNQIKLFCGNVSLALGHANFRKSISCCLFSRLFMIPLTSCVFETFSYLWTVHALNCAKRETNRVYLTTWVTYNACCTILVTEVFCQVGLGEPSHFLHEMVSNWSHANYPDTPWLVSLRSHLSAFVSLPEKPAAPCTLLMGDHTNHHNWGKLHGHSYSTQKVLGRVRLGAWGYLKSLHNSELRSYVQFCKDIVWGWSCEGLPGRFNST